MMDVVFSESARGSLICAQHYGRGAFSGHAVGVFCSTENGEQLSGTQPSELQARAEAEARGHWESCTPMGGRREDIFGFDLAHSIGPITDLSIGAQRRQTLERLWGIYPDYAEAVSDSLSDAKQQLDTLLQRARGGEAMRFWISHNPNELCGFLWLMTVLEDTGCTDNPMSCIMLPDLIPGRDDRFNDPVGCGGVAPHEWHMLLPLEAPLSVPVLRACAAHWKTLQKENAPLRVVLNGRVVSADADLYDRYILQELALQPAEFREAMVVGAVLGKYALGLGDAWVDLRIEEMIRQGALSVVESADTDSPRYHRILRKNS